MTYKISNEFLKQHVEHKQAVGIRITNIISDLTYRAVCHDDSKLSDVEREAFEKQAPQLKDLTYGSDEYHEARKNLGAGLEHHYEHNQTHHPDHVPNRMEGMNLVDLIEMVCDWAAATERHEDGDIFASLEHNKERFQIPEPLYNVLYNTIETYGLGFEGRMYDE